MGFSRYRNGPVLPCKITDGVLQARLPSGKVLVYKTGLKVTIPEQTILFRSPTVMFCLDYEDKTYIGREDGSISIYSPCGTNRLSGLNNWEAPFQPVMPVVGFISVGDQVEEIYLDLVDRQTLYHGNKGEYYVLPQQILAKDLQYDRDKCLAAVQSSTSHIKSLVMQDGKEVISNVLWSVAKASGSGDIRMFF